MECFNCLKQCRCQITIERDTDTFHFCTEACEDAYIKEDIRTIAEKGVKGLTEKLNYYKSKTGNYKQCPLVKVTCAELILCKSIVARRPRTVLNQLYKLYCEAQVDIMEDISKRFTEGTYLEYADSAKEDFDSYRTFIELS
jgi:hypothetical protein